MFKVGIIIKRKIKPHHQAYTINKKGNLTIKNQGKRI